MDTTIRELTTADVIMLAREQAESMQPCRHDFEPGSTQACAWERAYLARQRELEEFEG